MHIANSSKPGAKVRFATATQVPLLAHGRRPKVAVSCRSAFGHGNVKPDLHPRTGYSAITVAALAAASLGRGFGRRAADRE
jgi:hypothetical protein